MWYSEFHSGELDHEYMSLAIQYYLLARVGSQYIFNPVSGSLYHHAFELFLKAYLVKHYSRQELKSKYSHKLVKLWSNYKKHIKVDALDKFDLIVKNLDAWERVRYLRLEQDENAAAIELVGGHASNDYLNQIETTDFKSQKWFTLHTDDMDQLFKAIAESLKISPEEFLKNPSFVHGKEIYEYKNKYSVLNNESRRS